MEGAGSHGHRGAIVCSPAHYCFVVPAIPTTCTQLLGLVWKVRDLLGTLGPSLVAQHAIQTDRASRAGGVKHVHAQHTTAVTMPVSKQGAVA